MISLIITSVCLAVVFGLVIWNIVYTVTRLKKLRAELEHRYAMDAAQNRRLLSQSSTIQEISTKVTGMDSALKDVTQKRLPGMESAIKENEALISDLQAVTEEELVTVGGALAEMSGSIASLQSDNSTLSEDLKMFKSSTVAGIDSLKANYAQFQIDVQELSDGVTSLTSFRDNVTSMVDMTNNKLVAGQLCLDSTCVGATQLQNMPKA